jgi:hypothetical protein
VRNTYKILFKETERKRLCGRYMFLWGNNNRVDLEELDRRVWIGLIWLRVGTSSELL